MAREKKPTDKKSTKRPIVQYEHADKERLNNPPAGLVTPKTDPDGAKKKYIYDPHLDPTLQFDSGRSQVEGLPGENLRAARQAGAALEDFAKALESAPIAEDAQQSLSAEGVRAALAAKLKDVIDASAANVTLAQTLDRAQQPYLQWAGKAEHTSFEVPTVSLHVHERIDPRTIIEAVRKRNGSGANEQMSLFARPEENPPLRDAVEFYKHRHDWSNRLIAGDSLLVMNSLLEKEGLAGQVQMIYIDPPYGIRYGSNFQPFVNNREVTDGKDEDLTQEPEMIKAFRDTWELGIHSYLTYLRDRLLLARELLHESGSCFVQISDENVHHVRELMDEVFGPENYCGQITFSKTTGLTSKLTASTFDFLIWYARKIDTIKFHQLFREKLLREELGGEFKHLDTDGGGYRTITDAEVANPGSIDLKRLFRTNSAVSPGVRANTTGSFEVKGLRFDSGKSRNWKTTIPGMIKLASIGRLVLDPDSVRIYKQYWTDFTGIPITNAWTDVRSKQDKIYVVQTADLVVTRCLLMTTDPGDIIFDPTCGSGTTAYVAEQRGRRWITCDTSRVATALAKQRLMTSVFDYYELAHPEEGVGSGFRYKTVPHIMLKSIANNPEIREGMTREQIDVAIQKYAEQETLYDQPYVDRSKVRVAGPFTAEAVPAPMVKPLDDVKPRVGIAADASIARSGASVRHAEWRAELLKTGIRGRGGQYIQFARLEPLPGTRWLHADGETKGEKAQRVVFSFGPEHGPLEARQVALAVEEAQTLVPKPELVVFAAFHLDSEAQKDIDETRWPGVTLLKAQMNADLLTDDLKKKRASNDSFWLIGQPDVRLEQLKTGAHKGKFQVVVQGFDYYNTRSGTVESGGTDKIAMWMLDTDYDGRSVYPRQVFFPMADADEGWAKLARNLKAEIDSELIEAYRGTKSLPFASGTHERVAVKIIDDRGIESLKVVRIGE